MTLRSRLAAALMAAAVLPMLVAVGVPLLRSEERARKETERRTELVRRQAGFLVERALRTAEERVERAATELARDRAAQDRLLEGPEENAREVARAISERHGLDPIEVVGASGKMLATSRPDGRAGERGTLADAPPDDAVVLGAPEGAGGAAVRPGLVARRPVPFAREPIVLVGRVVVGRELIASVARITGGPTGLVDPSGRAVEEAGEPLAGPRATVVVPLGASGWRIRIETAAWDVASERRDRLASVAGLAPLALLSALVLGIVLAGTISRPIRALADRADAITVERSGFALLDPPRDEVVRLTRSFDRMLDAVSGSERQRVAAERIAAWQEVARRIAHEVKNPLSPIKLAVENLRRTRERAPAEFDRALDEETATILEEVESLRRLVDEFSQFARLPAPRFEPCDPRKVVRQALSLFAARIAALGVEVEVRDAEAPDRIDADPEQIGRAIKNVVANALDAVEPVADRRLTITLRGAATANVPAMEVEVRDSGIGLDPEAARRIFEPYYTTRSDRGGTGLGMAIAFRIVSEHGGTIEATGAPGHGATVTLRLPGAGGKRIVPSGS